MGRSKREEGGSVRNDSRILSVGSVQIDFLVRFSGVRMEDFSSFPGRFAEKVGTTCGEKKCFFSQAIFRSAEIGTRLDLKTVEKQAEIPKICI